MDIRAYNQRIESLKQKSDQLEDENFHDIDTITKRYVLRFRTFFSVHCPISPSRKIYSEIGRSNSIGVKVDSQIVVNGKSGWSKFDRRWNHLKK